MQIAQVKFNRHLRGLLPHPSKTQCVVHTPCQDHIYGVISYSVVFGFFFTYLNATECLKISCYVSWMLSNNPRFIWRWLNPDMTRGRTGAFYVCNNNTSLSLGPFWEVSILGPRHMTSLVEDLCATVLYGLTGLGRCPHRSSPLAKRGVWTDLRVRGTPPLPQRSNFPFQRSRRIFW